MDFKAETITRIHAFHEAFYEKSQQACPITMENMRENSTQ